jgi:molybdopterin converting factor subunit 1
MTVRVLFFGIVRERIGVREEVVELPARASVADLLSTLSARHARFGEGAGSLRVAVNEEYVDSTATLSDNDEVAIIPPVSGGLDVQDHRIADFARRSR